MNQSPTPEDKTATYTVFPAGTLIGHYRIIEKIGAGGMGEVYLAEDTALNRRVALKFLPPQYAEDEAFRARFIREARSAAALNHPNIVHIYEVAEFQRRPYFAMEHIEGNSLHHFAHEQPLPLNKIIDLIIPICEGLNKAHQMGVIHRDIKTANILVDAEDRPKILDFGLATIQGGEKLTKVGSTIGTVAYMSPEQASGAAVDQRSDLFSLGVVFYELIAARTPFKRDTDAATMRAILEESPEPLARYRANVPVELQRIVSKLLERDRALRYQTASGVISDLKKLAISSSSGSVAPVRPKKKRARLVAIAVGVLLVAAALGVLTRRLGPPSEAPTRDIKITSVTNDGKAGGAAISPDGKYVVFTKEITGRRSLWIKQIATSSTVQIVAPTRADLWGAIFSPDGNYVYYVTRDTAGGIASLCQLPVLGGTPKTVLNDIDSRVSWSPDGKRFAFTRYYRSSGDFAIMLANADGTGVQRLAGAKAEVWYYGIPAWSPDGQLVVCAKGYWQPKMHAELVAVRVRDGAEVWKTSHSWVEIGSPVWLADGSALVTCGTETGQLFHQVWQVDYPSGSMRRITNDLTDYSGLTISADNAVLAVTNSDVRAGVWVVPDGRTDQARQVTSGKVDGLGGLCWVPDGSIIYTARGTKDWGLWKVGLSGGEAKQLITGMMQIGRPTSTIDGRYIVFMCDRAGIPNLWRIDSAGGKLTQITTGGEDYQPAVTPDGKWVVFGSWDTGPFLVTKVSIDGGEPVPLTQKNSSQPAVSPDGKWIACLYQDDQDSPTKVGVMPTAGGGFERTLTWPSTAGGQIAWAPDGKALLYVDTRDGVSNLWSRPIDGGPPSQLTNFTTDQISAFAFSADGKQLAVSRGTTASDVVLISDFR